MIDIFESAGSDNELTLAGLTSEQEQHIRSLVEQWNSGKVPERMFAVRATATRIDKDGKESSDSGLIYVTRDSDALVAGLNRYYDEMEEGTESHYLNISRSKGGNMQATYRSVSAKNDMTGYKYKEEVEVTPFRIYEFEKQDVFEMLRDGIGKLY